MSVLLLDKIRGAALPQPASYGLLCCHARVLEGLARGTNKAELLSQMLTEAESHLHGWDLVGLFELEGTVQVLGREGGSLLPTGDASRLATRARKLPTATILRAADSSISMDLWQSALPKYPLGYFASYPLPGAPSVLLALTTQHSRLSPAENESILLLAELADLVLARSEPLLSAFIPSFASGGDPFASNFPGTDPFQPSFSAPPPAPAPPPEPEVRLDQICYSLLWALTNNAVCLIDPTGAILSGNDQLGAMLGCPVENFVGRSLEEYLADGEPRTPLALSPQPEEHHFQHWTGATVAVSVRGSDLVDAKGNHLGRLVVMEKAPEVAQATPPTPEPVPQAAPIAPTDENYAVMLGGMLRAVSDGIILVDSAGRIMTMNTGAEKLTGVPAAQAKGYNLGDVCILHVSGHSQPYFSNLTMLAEKTQGWQADCEIPNGTLDHMGEFKIDVSVAVAPLRDSAGTLAGLVLCMRDITEMNTRLRERADAEHFKSLSLLAGGIAHDLNNILTALVGNISLANILVSDTPEISDRLVEAERACFRAKDLSHQLLTFSKGGTPVKKVARLEDLVNQSVEFFLRGSKSAAKIVIKPGLWSVNIDESQINQVIETLIINADHSMPDGGNITVACQNFHYVAGQAQQRLPLEDGFYVKLTITDEGPGVPHEHLEHIFKPYYTTREFSHGLGLATTYTTIKNHKGHIGVTSAVGAGTEFSIYLPATGTTKSMDTQTSKSNSKREYPGRILVVDDEKSIRDLASTTLELMGCEVTACRSSTEGVQSFLKARDQGKPYDLVIMDLTLPGDLGGNEAMQQILQIEPGARGIASSGYSEGSVMSHYREYGFQAALSKPYNISDLQRVVSTMLQG